MKGSTWHPPPWAQAAGTQSESIEQNLYNEPNKETQSLKRCVKFERETKYQN